MRLVDSGDLSASDLVHAHLDRISALDPAIGAFVDLRADQALAEARAQDEAASHRTSLGGLPVTVKSAIEVAGLRCETGSPFRAGVMATGDAVVVRRLKEAGAIVIGTTNVAEMLMGYETDNPLHGRTVNPWDPTLGPLVDGRGGEDVHGDEAGRQKVRRHLHLRRVVVDEGSAVLAAGKRCECTMPSPCRPGSVDGTRGMWQSTQVEGVSG